MLTWAFRNNSIREISGQIIRILGAAIVTPLGLVPLGNTGGQMSVHLERCQLIQSWIHLLKKQSLTLNNT
jgi:hypothetical protein